MRSEKRRDAYNYGRKSNYNTGFYSGDGEVFLSIEEKGYFTIELEDQMMSNPRGKFRFFEVNSGENVLSIYKNGYLVYRTSISVLSNSRLVLELVQNQLFLLDVQPILHPVNGLIISNYKNNPSEEMMSSEYEAFKSKMLDSAPFDKDKVKLIELQLSTGASFRASQIKDLLSTFSFDSKRLEAAKMLYNSCSDKKNFFTILDVFDFETSKRSMNKYIRKGR